MDRHDFLNVVNTLAEWNGKEKLSADLTKSRRESLTSSQFAIPKSKAEKIGVGDEIQGESAGKYPIFDIAHARNALARVSQHGTPSEREAVRQKVYSKYPELREGFEEQHGGENPIAKKNIKKVEQGDIGKSASIEEKAMSKRASAEDGFFRGLSRF